MKTGLVSTLAALALLALSVSSASAAEVHSFSKSFGAGELSLAEHSGVAVNHDTGNVYVADTGNGHVSEFTADGAPVQTFGSFISPTFVAVDNSGGASSGDVYVADTSTNTVAKFGPGGNAITTWGDGGVLSAPFTTSIAGIAVDDSGNLFVYLGRPDEFSPNRMLKFDQGGSPLPGFDYSAGYSPGITVDGIGNSYVIRGSGAVVQIDSNGVPLNGEIDPGFANALAGRGSEFFVAHPGEISRYTASGALVEAFGSGHLSNASGVAIASDGTVYVADSATGEIAVFGPVLVPDAATEEATNRTRSTAVLHGTVGAAEGPPATCVFQYVTEATFFTEGFANPESAPCEPPGPFTGSAETAVSAAITGLTVGTSYRFRLFAENANGANPLAGVVAFETAPALGVTVTEPTNIGRGNATIHGAVTPEGAAVETCEFEYVTREAYNSEGFASATKAPCFPEASDLGEGDVPQSVDAEATGLSGGTEYVFRLRATNSYGTSVSGEASFTTSSAVHLATGAATDLHPTEATLNGSVNPEGAPITECAFEYVTQSQFSEEGFASASKVPCAEDEADIGAGVADRPVHAVLTGLPPSSRYHFRLTARSMFGSSTGVDEVFETYGPPTIEEIALTEVGQTTATIEATINPHGEPTTVQVQYVTQADFEATGFSAASLAPVPGASLGQGTVVTSAAIVLSGLHPSTAYRFRVVAGNPAEPEVISDVQAFVTQAGPVTGLPDGRAYELVSPVQKESGEVFPGQVNPSGLSGGCIGVIPGETCVPGSALTDFQPFETGPQGDSIVYSGQPFSPYDASLSQYRAVRSSSGWTTAGLTPLEIDQGSSQGYKQFSQDLGRGIVREINNPLTPDAPSANGVGYANLYLTEDGHSFEPLVTTTPPIRSAGTSGVGGAIPFEINYGGANSGSGSVPPLSHVIFAANDALTAEVPGVAPAAPSVTGTGCAPPEDCNLYEWSDGQLHLVNVLPGNTETAELANFGQVNRNNQEQPVNYDGVISADGSRIFWSAAGGQVYVRVDAAETLRVEDPGEYVLAASDGSKVLLNDGCLYDVDTAQCAFDLSGGGGGFQGILGASSDLDTVYYVDTGVLTGNQLNANGEEATAGAENLYVWNEGSVKFIAGLLPSDNEGPLHIGTWAQSRSSRSAQVTPDGRYLAFMSAAPLTGYDNRAVGTACQHGVGRRCREVFEYDNVSSVLTCPSCSPSGVRPLGGGNLNLMERQVVKEAGLPQPSNLPAEGHGRLFFESRDGLLPEDHNRQGQDVYEWKPIGIGSCTKPEGCLALISAGRGTPRDESYFGDASPSGNDVFFVTRDQLVRRDRDELLDLYDARVGGGFPEPASSVVCESRNSCQGPVAVPAGGSSAGTATFVGPGNTSKPCKRRFVRRHGRCVKRRPHHKKHHRPKQHGAGHRAGGSK